MPFSSWGTMLIFVVIRPPFSVVERAVEKLICHSSYFIDSEG